MSWLFSPRFGWVPLQSKPKFRNSLVTTSLPLSNATIAFGTLSTGPLWPPKRQFAYFAHYKWGSTQFFAQVTFATLGRSWWLQATAEQATGVPHPEPLVITNTLAHYIQPNGHTSSIIIPLLYDYSSRVTGPRPCNSCWSSTRGLAVLASRFVFHLSLEYRLEKYVPNLRPTAESRPYLKNYTKRDTKVTNGIVTLPTLA